MLTLNFSYPYTLYFLRHAQAEDKGEDFHNPLSSKGLLQAQEAKLQLENVSFDLVISSPALRAKTTAEIVASHSSIKEIKSLYELLQYAQDITLGDILHFEEDENQKIEALMRLKKAFLDVLETVFSSQAKTILIVAHSGVINVLAALFAKEHAASLLRYPIRNAESLILHP